jgi:hypothetical protein
MPIMTVQTATTGAGELPRSEHSQTTGRLLALVVMLVLVLLPVWWWPLVATQDGPSHLYNATVVNESLAGHGPSTAIYEVAWKPLPNWGGTLLLMALLKIVPLSFVPRVMLTLIGVAPIAATLWLRHEAGSARGWLWTAAFAACLATGRAWAMGFESFSLGIASALCVIALYVRFRERLNLTRSLAIGGLLVCTFFCHLVPWAFAAGTIAVLAFTGSTNGSARRLLWSAAVLLATTPLLFLYRSISAAQGGGIAFDWSHLKALHLLSVRSWLMLLARADCIGVMRHLIPFTTIGSGSGESAATPAGTSLVKFVLARVVFEPFVLILAAAVLQSIATLVRDVRSRSYRRIVWFLLGLGGITLALFMPDGTPQNGTFLPFRVMLLSLTLFVVYVRFDVGRVVNVATGVLVAAGFALHTTAIWDYASSSNRQMLEVKNAVATIPSSQRIYQIGTIQNSRFLADPLLHCDSDAALWSSGVLLSNYEAAHYYFPVKLRPEYPQTLVTQVSQLQELDPKQDADFARVHKFLADHERYIDVVLVRTADQQLVSLAQTAYGDVLWHSDDLWVLRRRPQK